MSNKSGIYRRAPTRITLPRIDAGHKETELLVFVFVCVFVFPWELVSMRFLAAQLP